MRNRLIVLSFAKIQSCDKIEKDAHSYDVRSSRVNKKIESYIPGLLHTRYRTRANLTWKHHGLNVKVVKQ